MKAIMISIQPQHVCNIVNLIKKLEIRTTAPKEWKDYLSGKTDKKPEPIDVYIYCTEGKPNLWLPYEHDCFELDEASEPYLSDEPTLDIDTKINGKVVAKFTLKEVEKINAYSILDTLYETKNQNIKQEELLKLSCLTYQELNAYLKQKGGYAWHIDNLVVFDKTKEISEFKTIQKGGWDLGCFNKGDKGKPLTRAPQSWCYVEE